MPAGLVEDVALLLDAGDAHGLIEALGTSGRPRVAVDAIGIQR